MSQPSDEFLNVRVKELRQSFFRGVGAIAFVILGSAIVTNAAEKEFFDAISPLLVCIGILIGLSLEYWSTLHLHKTNKRKG